MGKYSGRSQIGNSIRIHDIPVIHIDIHIAGNPNRSPRFFMYVPAIPYNCVYGSRYEYGAPNRPACYRKSPRIAHPLLVPLTCLDRKQGYISAGYGDITQRVLGSAGFYIHFLSTWIYNSPLSAPPRDSFFNLTGYDRWVRPSRSSGIHVKSSFRARFF